MNWSGRKVSTGVNSPGNGRQLELSYRHGASRGGVTAQTNKASINALFFDGSVRRLNDRASRNPVFWYPKGAPVEDASQGMIDLLQNGDKIP